MHLNNRPTNPEKCYDLASNIASDLKDMVRVFRQLNIKRQWPLPSFIQALSTTRLATTMPKSLYLI